LRNCFYEQDIDAVREDQQYEGKEECIDCLDQGNGGKGAFREVPGEPLGETKKEDGKGSKAFLLRPARNIKTDPAKRHMTAIRLTYRSRRKLAYITGSVVPKVIKKI
jgi:hypothetical protein